MADYKVNWMKDFFSRSRQRQGNILGVIPYPTDPQSKLYRSPKLEILDAYFEGCQYEHLPPWQNSKTAEGAYVPVRQRAPSIAFPFAKVLAQRVASKLVGNSVFPALKITDDPDTELFFQQVSKASKIRTTLLEATRRMLAASSHFVRFYLVDGVLRTEGYKSKHCYPVFGPTGELTSILIRYVYTTQDPNDKDKNGNLKRYWFQLELGQMEDIQYLPIEFNPESKDEPEKVPAEVVPHELGFVQGEWLRTCELKDSPDGYSLIEDVLGFIDATNYSLSQSDQAVSYNQDPQLVFNKMTEEETTELIRSSMKSWNLGREGDAKFLEAGLNGVEVAQVLRDTMKLGIGDIARVVFMDPEKIVSHAQSGEALKILHGPMVDLIDELRPGMGDAITSLHLKMGVMLLMMNARGAPVPIEIPKGFTPLSLALEPKWPPIFPMTIEDLQKKVGVASAATSSNLISRATGTRFLAEDFGVVDIEAEVLEIDSQKVLNPFGGF